MSRMTRFVLGAFLAVAPSHSFANENVSFALDWLLSGIHAGYFVARDKGYYSEKGLNVTISRGFGSGDTVKRVATGSSDFGLADTGAVVAARSNDDIPVRIVAMIFDQATLGVIYRKDSGISQPKDLEGRTLARSASGASVNMLPGFLKANNIDRTKIREIVVDAATYLPLLMSGQADAILEQAVLMGKFSREGVKYGKEVAAMLYSDYGLPAYGTAIITQHKRTTENPDMVRRFTDATLRGLAYALENPGEAVDTLLKSNPEIDRNAAMDELIALRKLQSTEDVQKNGLGYIRKEKMDATIKTVTDALSLKRHVTAEQVYSDGFLPKTPFLIAR
jgi:NitT/TauT family transport system substrate-binding protein